MQKTKLFSMQRLSQHSFPFHMGSKKFSNNSIFLCIVVAQLCSAQLDTTFYKLLYESLSRERAAEGQFFYFQVRNKRAYGINVHDDNFSKINKRARLQYKCIITIIAFFYVQVKNTYLITLRLCTIFQCIYKYVN